MELSEGQQKELVQQARSGQPAYVRVKALALLNRADGRTVQEVARIFRVSRPSVYLWERRYQQRGIAGLRVQPGRGRKARADLAEVTEYVRQSPRRFGVNRNRWTLASLAAVVPSLRGFSPFGVQLVLARAGFGYKRGQPHLHSPDPQYAAKKGRWSRR